MMNRRDFLASTSALGITLINGNISFAETNKDKDTAVIYLFNPIVTGKQSPLSK